MSVREGLRTFGGVMLILGTFVVAGLIGALVNVVVPREMHRLLMWFGLLLFASSGFGVWLHGNPWRCPAWLTKKRIERISWAVGITGFVLMLWFSPPGESSNQ